MTYIMQQKLEENPEEFMERYERLENDLHRRVVEKYGENYKPFEVVAYRLRMTPLELIDMRASLALKALEKANTGPYAERTGVSATTLGRMYTF